jgi:hypothetical protein
MNTSLSSMSPPPMPKIVAVFPGMGKRTTIKKLLENPEYNTENVLNFNSEPYSWCVPAGETPMKPGCFDTGNPKQPSPDRYRNEKMADDYVNDLKIMIQEKNKPSNPLKVVFISTHDAVLKKLLEQNIDFIAIFPDASRKEAYLADGGQLNGYPQTVKEYVKTNWDKFMSEFNLLNGGKKIIKKEGFLETSNFIGGRKSRRRKRKNRKSRKSRSRR